ncbi:hypothetical protein [Pseudomonas protegens]|uniref:hypothetical protein n=1 Tax=Pseudomonas protegens TaxID=380021 RepID=UPI00069D6704|nr:hypothetical protein [Pseudomonas protegens]
MNVFLLLYLCTNVDRTDCQVIPLQRWVGPDAYQQCVNTVPGLTEALTAPNRELHEFDCEIQAASAQPGEQTAQPGFIHQSFWM